MKKLILFIAGLLIVFIAADTGKVLAENGTNDMDNPVKIICSPDLYQLTKEWTEGFGNSTAFEIQVVEPDDMAYEMRDGEHVALVSESCIKRFTDESSWRVVIGRNVFVPVINSNNPFIERLRISGIPAVKFTEIFTENHESYWNILDEKGSGYKINRYFSTEESAMEALSEFMRTTKNGFSNIPLKDGSQLAAAIQNDIYALGFCKLSDITDPLSGEILSNISLVPIDRNNSGKIEHFEDIYGNLNDFARGVWIGKYPKSLVGNIYAAGNSARVNTGEASFLKWVVTDGQKTLEPYGYSTLVGAEKQSILEKLNKPYIFPESQNNYASVFMFLIIFLFIVIAVFVAGFVINSYRKKILQKADHGTGKLINESELSFPNGLYFDRTHTWAFMEKNGSVRVGIDDFLQHITGNYTRVKMKKQGEKIKKNEQLLSLIQDGKQLNVYSPVSGTIIGVNKSLANEPTLINSSTYDEGWLYMIEPSNWLREIQFLKMAEAHQEWLKAEFIKLKNFLLAKNNITTQAGVHFVMQDGGALTKNVLQEMGPKVWEDFQKDFMDNCGIN
ncbi:MAG: hypothetical protein K9H16_08360 [Bacteroidales bacterium]|nr:hypothetical protein [Bacteroidales bacterium]